MSETPRTDEVVGQREYGSLADSEYVRLARTLERELNEAKKDWKTKQSELMHKKFFFQPHPDDPKKCNCAYCARDFEAVAEHAAYLEMDVNSLERDRDEWKACAEELAKNINKVSFLITHHTESCKVEALRQSLAAFNQLKAKSK